MTRKKRSTLLILLKIDRAQTSINAAAVLCCVSCFDGVRCIGAKNEEARQVQTALIESDWGQASGLIRLDNSEGSFQSPQSGRVMSDAITQTDSLLPTDV